MYICLCHQLTDKQLRETYRDAETAAQVFELLGEVPICGKCVDYIESDLRRRSECAACPGGKTT